MQIKKIATLIVVLAFVFLLGRTFFDSFSVNPRSQLAQVGSSSDLCTGYGDDRDYNYNLLTSITNKADGTETFQSQRRSDGRVLRQNFSDERFFVDKSNGAIRVSYDIVDWCGGVDIIYTVTNPTAQNQNAPELRVEGVMQNTTGDFYLLDTRDAGYIRNVRQGSGPSNIFLGSSGRENAENLGALSYPGFYYSPVIVAHDEDFAVGSSLMYPYLQYKHEIVPQLTKVTSGIQTGTWRHEYKEFSPSTYARLGPNEQRVYTVSMRFTEPRSWILTLDPYKKYFKQVYGVIDQVRAQDVRPVYGVEPTSAAVYSEQTNSRSYRVETYYGPLINEGWTTFVDTFLSEVEDRGFERAMVWTPSGLYSPRSTCGVLGYSDFRSQDCNYPPAFMDFPSHLASTDEEFEQFAENGVELGFWWGRSSQVPVPQQWDPPMLVQADYLNSSHVSFLDNQLTQAYQRGAKIIGLDAFGGTTYERNSRIDRLKQLTSNKVLFVHEGSGPDILHRKVANFYYLRQYDWWTQFDKQDPAGPDVLSRYLNEGAEVWFFHDRPPYCGGNELERMASWGFTPIYFGTCVGHYPVDLSNLDLSQVVCFDGVDNDGDGRKDWPYDPGCSDPTDNNEFNVTAPGDAPPPSSDGSSGSGGSSRSPSQTPSREYLVQKIQELQTVLNSLTAQFAARNAVQTPTVTPPRPATTPRPRTSSSSSSGSGTSGIYWIPDSHNFNVDLTLGSSGPEVVALQRFLENRGLLVMPEGVGYGGFGIVTQEAVARLQSFVGITPTGQFDSETRARVNQF